MFKKIIRVLPRLVIFLVSLAYAALGIFIGGFTAGPTGLFGVSNTVPEQISGITSILFSVLTIAASFFVFRKNILVPVIVLGGSAIASSLVRGIVLGFGMEADSFFNLYIFCLAIFYWLSRMLDKKFSLPEEAAKQEEVIAKEPVFPQIKKILISFLVILATGIFLFNFLLVWVEKAQVKKHQRQALTSIGFKVFEPSYIPEGHDFLETRVEEKSLAFYYHDKVKGGIFLLSEFKKPVKIILNPPNCQIGGFAVIKIRLPGDIIDNQDYFKIREGSGWASSVSGLCQEIKTPQGVSVYLMTYNLTGEKKLAAAILGETLITLNAYNFSDEEVVKIIDGLQEKSPSEINLKVDDRTIGR